MPNITTSSGKIHFRTKSLYPGIKYIDKEIAIENLSLLKEILDKNSIHFLLVYGTLLGAVRERDFISHDEDIDIALFQEDKQKVFDVLPQLMAVGFKIARYDRRSLLSLIRMGEYIDLYFFQHLEDRIWSCEGNLMLEKFLFERSNMEFRGHQFEVPADYIGYLEFEYGKSWITPIEWHDFKIPIWKRFCFVCKEKIKDILPDYAFGLLARRTMNRTETLYREKIEQYLRYGGKI